MIIGHGTLDTTSMRGVGGLALVWILVLYCLGGITSRMGWMDGWVWIAN